MLFPRPCQKWKPFYLFPTCQRTMPCKRRCPTGTNPAISQLEHKTGRPGWNIQTQKGLWCHCLYQPLLLNFKDIELKLQKMPTLKSLNHFFTKMHQVEYQQQILENGKRGTKFIKDQRQSRNVESRIKRIHRCNQKDRNEEKEKIDEEISIFQKNSIYTLMDEMINKIGRRRRVN